MKTETKVEKSLLILRGRSLYTNDARDERIVASALKNAQVGAIFSSYGGSEPRGNVWETLEVVYKNGRGVAGLLRSQGYYDSSAQEKEWAAEPVLIWFEIP